MKSDIIRSSLYLEGHLCLSEHTSLNETVMCVRAAAAIFSTDHDAGKSLA